jgi:hypothetical protein
VVRPDSRPADFILGGVASGFVRPTGYPDADFPLRVHPDTGSGMLRMDNEPGARAGRPQDRHAFAAAVSGR